MRRRRSSRWPAIRRSARSRSARWRTAAVSSPTSAKPLFMRALADADPRVQLEAITGLRRIGATDAAAAMLPLTASTDPVDREYRGQCARGARPQSTRRSRPCKGPSDENATGALRVLQQIHQPAAVTGLIAALSDAPPARRARDPSGAGAAAQSRGRLARHAGGMVGHAARHHRAVLRPGRLGRERPHSRRAAGALLESAAGARTAADVTRLMSDLQRNRVLPPGGEALLSALGTDRHALLGDVARALIGRVRLDVDADDRPAARSRRARANTGTARRSSGWSSRPDRRRPPPAPSCLQRRSITKLDADARAAALTALASSTGPEALRRSVDAFSSVSPVRRVAGERHRARTGLDAVHRHAGARRERPDAGARWSTATTPRASGWGLPCCFSSRLIRQLRAGVRAADVGGGGGGGGGRGRGGISPEVVDRARAEARAIIDGAWTGPAAASLVWAVGRTGAVRYSDRVDAAHDLGGCGHSRSRRVRGARGWPR